MSAAVHAAEPAAREPRRSGHRPSLRGAVRNLGPVLLVYGVLKLLGLLVFMCLVHYAGDYRFRPGGGAHAWDILGIWDGGWYERIVQDGYDPRLVPVPGGAHGWTVRENSAAFFPLYPATIRLVWTVPGTGLLAAGIAASVLASFAAALGINAVTSHLYGRAAGLAAVGLWAVWPGSGVEWAVYSDSLFTALAAWACYAVITRRWLTAGVLTCLAGLSRPTAVALVAAVALAALTAMLRGRKDGLRPLAAAVLSPLGLVGYLAWVGYRTGEPAGYFRLESDAWDHYFDYGRYTSRVVLSVIEGRSAYESAHPVEDRIAVAVVVLTVILIAALVRMRPPSVLTVYTVVSVVLVLGSHQIFGNMSRYLLAVFPLLIPAAAALRRLAAPTRAVLLAAAALASGYYAGYVLFELGVP